MSGAEGRAVLLLARWRRLVDAASKLPTFDPLSPDLARLLPEFVELSDDTDRFLDDATDGIEARS